MGLSLDFHELAQVSDARSDREIFFAVVGVHEIHLDREQPFVARFAECPEYGL